MGDVGSIVLRDRKHLGQDGLIIIVASLDVYDGHVISGPDIVSRGFVYVRESEGLLEEADQTTYEAVMKCLDYGITDWSKIKLEIKDALSDFVWKRTQRRPMILPIIMETTL